MSDRDERNDGGLYPPHSSPATSPSIPQSLNEDDDELCSMNNEPNLSPIDNTNDAPTFPTNTFYGGGNLSRTTPSIFQPMPASSGLLHQGLFSSSLSMSSPGILSSFGTNGNMDTGGSSTKRGRKLISNDNKVEEILGQSMTKHFIITIIIKIFF